jgi:predicted RecB family nuclease
MQREGTGLRLAATDISNHLACRHLTQLDRAVAEGRRPAPQWRDPNIAVLQQRGFEHERAYIAHLKAQGLSVVAPVEEGGKLSMEKTVEAMRAGADVIVQAELRKDGWLGRADVLLKAARPSPKLGDWSYEVVDTKLAQETRAGAVLQLCLYCELVAEIQGRDPEHMHVVKPGSDFPRESFRYDDYGAYYRLVRARLLQAVQGPPLESTYPDPVPHCEVCRWWQHCDTQRHADDKLCLVAGIRQLHIAELERQDVHTLTQYAEEPGPFRQPPQRGSKEAFTRAHGQARIQLVGRREGGPRYRLMLPQAPGLGFYLLPQPDIGDVFFDIESDPFAGDGGMEYLLGIAHADLGGGLLGGLLYYTAFWSFTPSTEREAIERLVDVIMDRWRARPGMHVYHFSPYEPGAVKRLIGRHGTRGEELDQLLRAERFVDLLAVTRHGLLASVESYSLKELEKFCGFTRATELPSAAAALRRVAHALELTGAQDITAEDRGTVEAYNREDCLSTAALRDWLEERRREAEQLGGSIPRPINRSGDASEAVEERAADIQALYDRLREGIPDDREAWGPEERARWLLAHQLEYFRREEKSAWWDYFRIHGLDADDLFEERKAITGLTFVGAVDGGGRLPVHRYRYPEQEVDPDEGKELQEIGSKIVMGKLLRLDVVNHTLDIAKTARAAELHPSSVMINDMVLAASVEKSLLDLAGSIARNGVDGEGPYRAARDLLLARPPRLQKSGGSALTGGNLRKKGEDVVSAAIRLAMSLDNSFLPIQGPPGSGKTYTGAQMISALALEGKRIGVTAVSHKVIQKLLAESVKAASQDGRVLLAMRKDSQADGEAAEGVGVVKDNRQLLAGLANGVVVGGTAWFWSSNDMKESVDYLFVDEAGQMSLAQVLATARAARNLVLLGDPQQLEQPQKGAHPEGAEVAALVHILGKHKTMPDDAGLFLDVTWRLHPSICAFTSELFYESRLESRAGLEEQKLTGGSLFPQSGLYYVPVRHTGNQNSSAEEVDAIERIVGSLRKPGVTWTSAEGRAAQLGPQDILVVAPYNAQVAALSRRLGSQARVGTVDKFQGQEAPVVIYSMTSSSAQDAPRGMSFLYNPNRLNVATSRARCACIIVAAPDLLEPECRSPDQMRWANGLCRFRELAREVALPDADQ